MPNASKSIRSRVSPGETRLFGRCHGSRSFLHPSLTSLLSLVADFCASSQSSHLFSCHAFILTPLLVSSCTWHSFPMTLQSSRPVSLSRSFSCHACLLTCLEISFLFLTSLHHCSTNFTSNTVHFSPEKEISFPVTWWSASPSRTPSMPPPWPQLASWLNMAPK